MKSEENGANQGIQCSYENLKLVDQHYLIEDTSKKRIKIVCARTGMDYYGDKCVHVYRFRCQNRLTEGCKAQVTTDIGVNVILNESLVHSCIKGSNLYKEYENQVNETERIVQSYFQKQHNPEYKQKILQANEEFKNELEDNQSWRWCHECTQQLMIGTLIPQSNLCQHNQIEELLSDNLSEQSSLQESIKTSKKRSPSQDIVELEQQIELNSKIGKWGKNSSHLEKGDLSQTLLLSNQSHSSDINPNKDVIIERLSRQLSVLQNENKLLSESGKSENRPIINRASHVDGVVFKVQMVGADFEIRGNEWIVKQKS